MELIMIEKNHPPWFLIYLYTCIFFYIPDWRIQASWFCRKCIIQVWAFHSPHAVSQSGGCPVDGTAVEESVSYQININSLAPGGFGCNFKNSIFKLALPIGTFRASFDKVLRWMMQDLTDDKSTLVQVMAWCRQATSHYLSQCWPRSVSPYGVIRPQWVNSLAPERCVSNFTSVFFQMHFTNFYLEHFLWNWSQVAVLHWWEVNNWSGNGRCC